MQNCRPIFLPVFPQSLYQFWTDKSLKWQLFWEGTTKLPISCAASSSHLQQHTQIHACCCSNTCAEQCTFPPLDLQFHISVVWKRVSNGNPQHGKQQQLLDILNHTLYKHRCTWGLMLVVPAFGRLRREDWELRPAWPTYQDLVMHTNTKSPTGVL